MLTYFLLSEFISVSWQLKIVVVVSMKPNLCICSEKQILIILFYSCDIAVNTSKKTSNYNKIRVTYILPIYISILIRSCQIDCTAITNFVISVSKDIITYCKDRLKTYIYNISYIFQAIRL